MDTSQNCPRHLTCKICNKQNPSLLYVYFKESADAFPKTPVSSAHVHVDEHKGTVQRESMLSCSRASKKVRKISTEKNGVLLNTYAFLDPGNNATFYTENLMLKLNILGKPTSCFIQ